MRASIASSAWLLMLLTSSASMAWFANTAWADQGASASDQHRIAQLIEQLGDPSYIKREAARAELEKFGLVAFEHLNAAEMHPNVEVANSAAYLLDSMRVVWTLPTDSFDVQRLLKNYDEYDSRFKLDALQRLAKLEKADGYLALLRLVRYEKDERFSRIASLYVMEAVVDALKDKPAASFSWPELISAGIGESSRTSAMWLRTLSDQLDAAQSTAALTSDWHKLVLQERMLLESNAKDRAKSKTDEDIVKRLYRVVARLMIARGQRDQALAFFEPCLELVPKDSFSAFSDLQWMLESKLPEAVIALERQRPELLASRSRNRFLLAESYLSMGDKDKANAIAAEASDLSKLSAEVRRKSESFPADREASQRQENFEFLSKRGQFEWAENELKKMLQYEPKTELSPLQELNIRQELANFYWTADQNQQAADVWAPALRRAGLIDNPDPDTIDKKWQAELKDNHEDDMSYMQYGLSHYYFYLGLAEMQRNEYEAARQHFVQAIQADASDPDLLIAMHRSLHPPSPAVPADEAYARMVDEQIVLLESKYRQTVNRAESDLAMATARNQRDTFERIVAGQCNQLAWLLAGTERRPIDAIMLSERSNILTPNEAVYMDTLARCYFSAGHINKAITLQKRAIELMPYERSMQRRLDEFNEAAAKRATPASK